MRWMLKLELVQKRFNYRPRDEIYILLYILTERELCIVLVTLSSCLTIGVEIGLFLGVVSSICHLLYLWARPHITVITKTVGFFSPLWILMNSFIFHWFIYHSPIKIVGLKIPCTTKKSSVSQTNTETELLKDILF